MNIEDSGAFVLVNKSLFSARVHIGELVNWWYSCHLWDDMV